MVRRVTSFAQGSVQKVGVVEYAVPSADPMPSTTTCRMVTRCRSKSMNANLLLGGRSSGTRQLLPAPWITTTWMPPIVAATPGKARKAMLKFTP